MRQVLSVCMVIDVRHKHCQRLGLIVSVRQVLLSVIGFSYQYETGFVVGDWVFE